MIPILYWPTEKSFTSNGIGRLSDCVSCIVEEERNGIFECEFVYPVTGPLYGYIEKGMIVYVTHDDTGEPQPFEIYHRNAPIDGLVTFNAHHITYGASNVIVGPFGAAGAQAVAAGIKEHLLTPSEFELETDIESSALYSLTIPKSIRGMLAGEAGSLIDTFGGELEYNNFTIRLLQRRGRDTDVTIRYGKNLINLEQDEDYDGRYNAILPYWTNTGDGSCVYGNVVYASGIPSRIGILSAEDGTLIETEDGTNIFEISATKTQIRAYDFTEYFETQPTQEQLEALAATFLESNRPWLPLNHLSVDFVALSQTDEYEEYAPLQAVGLCDTVSVYHPALGIAIDGIKVIRTRYNVLLDKYDEIELGDPATTFADTIETGVAAQVAAQLNEALDQEGVFNRLTNNGKSQGLYIEDGNVYINASFIKSGIFEGVEFRSEWSNEPISDVLENDFYYRFVISSEGMSLEIAPVTEGTETPDESKLVAFLEPYITILTEEAIPSMDDLALEKLWFKSGANSDGFVYVEDLLDPFYRVTYTASYSISANAQRAFTWANFGMSTPAGYEIFSYGIVQSGHQNAAIVSMNPTSTSAALTLRNVTSSAISGTATVEVIYRKLATT